MPVLPDRRQGGLRGLRRWAGCHAQDSAAALAIDGGSAPTGDAPCQAWPPPSAELSSEAAIVRWQLVERSRDGAVAAGGASPLDQCLVLGSRAVVARTTDRSNLTSDRAPPCLRRRERRRFSSRATTK